MNIRDLDGASHNWLLTGNMAKGKTANKSSLHLKARAILSKVYPTLQILEEVPIPLRKNDILYLDFYLPLNKVCVEVHGEQHYSFVPFYHTNKLAFLKAQKRDKEKQQWCELNGIKYIVLPFNQEQQWEDIVVNN